MIGGGVRPQAGFTRLAVRRYIHFRKAFGSALFQTFASLLYMVTQDKYVTDLKHSSCRHTGRGRLIWSNAGTPARPPAAGSPVLLMMIDIAVRYSRLTFGFSRHWCLCVWIVGPTTRSDEKLAHRDRRTIAAVICARLFTFRGIARSFVL